MQLPRYSYKINGDFLDYEFISEGPKGSIKKIIRFTEIGRNLFNIGFGDLEESTGNINDIVVTNNGDSRMVMATVASAIYDFIIKYPDALIAAKGSTPARTRLYRIGITNHFAEINQSFHVFGLTDKSWEPFIKGKTYDAFLIQKK